MKGSRVLALLVAVAFLALVVQGVLLAAGPPDFTYPGKTQAPAKFSHKLHTETAKLACNACHTKIFKMKKMGTGFTMEDIRGGKACGTCHNGTKAFDAKAAANCARCHVKG